MALTGLDIFKLLPKKNCGECGVPTCLAFAMKLAAKAAEPTACPYLSDAAKATLGAAQAPPIKAVTVGATTLGGERFLYRHEKTFYNPTGIALYLAAEQPDFDRQVGEIAGIKLERVGEPLPVNFVYLDAGNAVGEAVAARVTAVQAATGLPVIIAGPLAVVERALLAATRGAIACPLGSRSDGTSCSRCDTGPSVGGAAPAAIAAAAIPKEVPVVIEAGTLDELLAAAGALADRSLILAPPGGTIAQLIESNTALRRAALKDNCKPAGHPLLNRFPAGLDVYQEAVWAATAICKYGSLIVLRQWRRAQLFPLLTLRQNIFSDPQRPLQMEGKVYALGEATPDSPALITTNFSLTYFIVSGEVENAAVPAHLLLVEADGMSVLTAWSANKFSAKIIADAVKKSGLPEKLAHKKLIIPGAVAVLSGDLEEQLPGWQILVGPAEAADLPVFFKEVWNRG